MEIHLRPQTQKFVDEKVASGAFKSAEEVIEAALSAFQIEEEFELDELDELRAEVKVGLDQLDRGEGEPWDGEAIKQAVRNSVRSKKAS